MTVDTVLLLLCILFAKHFMFDFVTQLPYQWMNKGTYGHPGGILHSGIHLVSTLVLLCMALPLQVYLAKICVASIIEFIVHYHTDWAKMNLNKKMKWAPNTHHEFWVLTGLDQLIHSLTYVWIVFYLC